MKRMLRLNFRLVCVSCAGGLAALLSGCAGPKVMPPPEVDPSVATTPAIGEVQPDGRVPAEISGIVAINPQTNEPPANAAPSQFPPAAISADSVHSQRPAIATFEATSSTNTVEDKLATSLKSFGVLRQELTGIVEENERLRVENRNLSSQLKEAVARADDALAALGRKEIEARDERLAREETDQGARILYSQLRAVARAVNTVGLDLEQLTDNSLPTARLEMNTGRLRLATDQTVTHKVKPGDTLQTLAQRYYGDSGKWRTIFNANRARLPLDGNLEAGSVIEIPKP